MAGFLRMSKRTHNPLPRDAMVNGIFQNPDEILFENEFISVIINIYPIAPGSCMVIPKRDVTDMTDLTPWEAYALLAAVEKTAAVLETAYGLPCMTLKYHGSHTTQDQLHVHVMPTDVKYRDLYYEYKNISTKKMSLAEISTFKQKFSPLIAK